MACCRCAFEELAKSLRSRPSIQARSHTHSLHYQLACISFVSTAMLVSITWKSNGVPDTGGKSVALLSGVLEPQDTAYGRVSVVFTVRLTGHPVAPHPRNLPIHLSLSVYRNIRPSVGHFNTLTSPARKRDSQCNKFKSRPPGGVLTPYLGVDTSPTTWAYSSPQTPAVVAVCAPAPQGIASRSISWPPMPQRT